MSLNLFTPVPRSEEVGSSSGGALGLTQRAAGSVACPDCGGDVMSMDPPGGWQTCPYCEKRLEIRVWQVVRRSTSAAPATREQATCFFHPDKAFQSCCQRCGRFVCALCDLQLGAEHVCPTCFERGRADTGPTSGKAEWRHRDVLYDSIAVALGWGWILVWPTVVAALPAVIVLHIKYRKAPSSYLIPRSGWRFWAAYGGFAWLALLITAIVLGQRIAGRH